MVTSAAHSECNASTQLLHCMTYVHTRRWPHTSQLATALVSPAAYGALCLLVDEAGCLVDARARALLAELPTPAGQCIAAASVVRALGVTDKAAFDALLRALRGGAEGVAYGVQAQGTTWGGGIRACGAWAH